MTKKRRTTSITQSAHERARKVLKRQLAGDAARKLSKAESGPNPASMRPMVVQLVRTIPDPDTFGLYRHFFAIQDNDGAHMRRIGHLLGEIQAACNNRFTPLNCELTIGDVVYAVTIYAGEHQTRQANEFVQRLMDTKTDLSEKWFPGLEDGIAAWAWIKGNVLLCWTVHKEIEEELLTSLRSR